MSKILTASEANLLKFCRLYNIQDLLKLIEEHHLFWAVHLRPVPGGWSAVNNDNITNYKTDRSKDMMTGSVRLGSFSRN